jgi:hypothetical protein
VQFAEQGSTVLAYPAILRAIEMVGRESVYFVVFEDNRFILDAMEIIPDGNVITMATDRATHLDPPRNLQTTQRSGLHAFRTGDQAHEFLGLFQK